MEVTVNDNGRLELLLDKWDIFVNLLAMGFTIALVVTVVVASIKLGWKLWPWVLAAGLLAFLFV